MSFDASAHPYPYPTTNTELKQYHNLTPHPEGGYYRETITLTSRPVQVQDKPTISQKTGLFSDQLDDRIHVEAGPGVILVSETDVGEVLETGSKLEATQIYYLLDPSSPIGYLHVNLHAHFILHHSGRSLYTFIKPSNNPDQPPEVQQVTLGPDPTKGEVLQLFVPGGWYKATEIPREDLILVDSAGEDDKRERIGAFITEVVVPGWTPKQCRITDENELKALWNGCSGWQEYSRYLSPRGE